MQMPRILRQLIKHFEMLATDRRTAVAELIRNVLVGSILSLCMMEAEESHAIHHVLNIFSRIQMYAARTHSTLTHTAHTYARTDAQCVQRVMNK